MVVEEAAGRAGEGLAIGSAGLLRGREGGREGGREAGREGGAEKERERGEKRDEEEIMS